MSVLGDAPALEVQPRPADQAGYGPQHAKPDPAAAASAPGEGAADAKPKPAGGGRRDEIQGLRAVAILLVAAYHIWMGRVSGGVDVFLMLTGFLITGSLLRGVERTGKVGFRAFIARVLRRLSPPAAIVLLSVLLGMFLWMPRGRWRDTFDEVMAAALYYENWHLALNSVDYLAGSGTASPVQHFWSLSIQGQFYLVWAALTAVAAFVALRLKIGSPRMVLLGLLIMVLGASLTYSIIKTASIQQWAYFDTGTRLWELALGGIAAIVLPMFTLPRFLRIGMGWLGLAGMVSCGLLLQVSTMFPGYIALWPTVSALLVVAAGSTQSKIGADRFLSSGPLKKLGDSAYALYLWHWPMLIFYITTSGKAHVDFISGSGILAVSLVLALITTSIADRAVDFVTSMRYTRTWSMALAMACIVPVVAVTSGWGFYLDKKSGEAKRLVADSTKYPGGEVFLHRGMNVPELTVLPDPADAIKDRPITYEQGCNQSISRSDVIVCVRGAKSFTKTLAIVGNSHSAHWFPALDRVAEANRWRLLVITKDACMFSDEPQTRHGKAYPACDAWQQGVLNELGKRKPDMVITISTHSSEHGETLTKGMLSRWNQLREMGIRVLAIRDLPRMQFDPPSCVEKKGVDKCVDKVSYSLAPKTPILGIGKRPSNVWFSDFTPFICKNGKCPAVIGNVLVYYDKYGHFTATFSRTLGPMMEQQVKRAFEKTRV